MNQEKETRLEILLEELDRTREAIAAGRSTRFRLMNGGALLMLALLLLGYTPWMAMAALALPYVALYVIVQYAYVVHNIAYGRMQAAGLETRINAELGGPTLAEHTPANHHYGPVGQSHFLGISAANVTGLLGASTLHFLVLCLILFAAGWARSAYIISLPEISPVDTLGANYTPVLLLWTVINVVYLVWYHFFADHEKTLAAAMRK